jgi:hypothetical protein
MALRTGKGRGDAWVPEECRGGKNGDASNGFLGPAPPDRPLSAADGSSVAASGSSGYNYYVLSCDQSGSRRFQDFRDHGDVVDRLRGEVALDLSLSPVGVQRCGEVAVLEYRERHPPLRGEPRSVQPERSSALVKARRDGTVTAAFSRAQIRRPARAVERT